ncbi:hypothetical protein [Mycobacterium sp. TY813]|uniref:hypothetical protein n=1 Tax=Mycobacterium TaxID=1763 RepID=UPI0027406295|nr:hypothetical protein [Mycobacterium sp. TY813]MDP7729514.1 hypothetical protein [Mycobacterium sp. TY813]
MKTIDQLDFYTEPNDDGKFIGRCTAFPKLRSRPHTTRVAAIDQIISLAAKKLRDIDDSRAQARQ